MMAQPSIRMFIALLALFLFTTSCETNRECDQSTPCQDDDTDQGDHGDDDNNDNNDNDDNDAIGAGDIWLDLTSGLMWQNADACCYNFEDAKVYCRELEWGGYDDWHLPSVSEYRTMIRGCPATETIGSCGVTDDCWYYSNCWSEDCWGCSSKGGPGPGGRYWPAGLNGSGWEYWSSTSSDDDSIYFAYFFFFRYGAISVYPTPIEYSVRCVRVP